MGAIYGLMHYIQHGTMIAPRTCPNSRELFHTLRGWVLSVVLSGSLNPPSDERYVPKALKVLATRASSPGAAQSSGILDTDPEPLRQAGLSVLTVPEKPAKGEGAAIEGTGEDVRTLMTQKDDLRPSSTDRPGITGRSPIDMSRSARPRLAHPAGNGGLPSGSVHCQS